MLRYLHYFEGWAMDERAKLIAMDGRDYDKVPADSKVEGLGKLEYF